MHEIGEEENELTSDRPRRANIGTGLEILQMNFGGKSYITNKEYSLCIYETNK